MRNPWTGGLLAILLRADDWWGAVWAWRVVRLVHAVPYLIAAAFFGYASAWLWGDPFPRVVGGWLCFGGVALGMCWDWWKDWRRG